MLYVCVMDVVDVVFSVCEVGRCRCSCMGSVVRVADDIPDKLVWG